LRDAIIEALTPKPDPEARAAWLAEERLIDAPPPLAPPTATSADVHAATLHAIQRFFAECHRFCRDGKPPLRLQRAAALRHERLW
jgi:hypothetical protein